MGVHAVLSPSSASRWSSCTASPGAAALNTEPDEGSDAARLGTCGHQMLEDALRDPALDLHTYLGREFWIDEDRNECWKEDWYSPDVAPTYVVVVDQDLIDAVLSARDYVTEQAALIGGEVFAEMRVPIDHITGEPGAHGTSDVIIVAGDLLWCLDLKLGRAKVDAYDVLQPASTDIVTGKHVPEVTRANLQLALYALGVMKALAPRKFTEVRLTIIQPFLNHVSDYHMPVAELAGLAGWLSARAEETRTNPQFVPSQKACHFCRAKGQCKAQTEMVTRMALEGLDDEPVQPRERQVRDVDLGTAYAMLPLVRGWCSAIEERVRVALEAGEPVVGPDGVPFKIVEGRKGNRAWIDEQAVDDALEVFDVPEGLRYKRKVLSPADAEKLAKVRKPKKGEEPVSPAIHPTAWSVLQAYITQSDGAPTIVPETDPRPALASRLQGFEDVPVAGDGDSL